VQLQGVPSWCVALAAGALHPAAWWPGAQRQGSVLSRQQYSVLKLDLPQRLAAAVPGGIPAAAAGAGSSKQSRDRVLPTHTAIQQGPRLSSRHPGTCSCVVARTPPAGNGAQQQQ
jgi:hypothetical protein